jgi:hypothetical protein
VTASVTDVSDIAADKDIRRNALGDLKPGRPGWLVLD